MSLVVITGGARSGKSSAATRLAYRRELDGARVVVATFGMPDGGEMSERIARHRDDRPEAFATIEATDASSWRDAVPSASLLVVDCLGTLVGRAMADAWPAGSDFTDAPADALPDGYAADVETRCDEIAAWLATRDGDTIVVTNEVGEGVVPGYATGRLFRDVLGRLNRALVADADAAYLAVAGRLIDLLSQPTEAAWPHD